MFHRKFAIKLIQSHLEHVIIPPCKILISKYDSDLSAAMAIYYSSYNITATTNTLSILKTMRTNKSTTMAA